MIIAVPAENQSLDSAICQSFGRAPFFCIYDTESESSRFIRHRGGPAARRPERRRLDHLPHRRERRPRPQGGTDHVAQSRQPLHRRQRGQLP